MGSPQSYHPAMKSPSIPAPTAWRVDFSESPMASYYSPLYAVVIDNCFTPAECAHLLREAESRNGWERAQINVGQGRQGVDLETRNSERIMLDDEALAKYILDKVKPFVEGEIGELDSDCLDPTGIAKHVLQKGRGKWRLTRLNERLRFLKYSPGEYFKPHWDRQYITPDKKEYSFLTLHLYLNDSSNPNTSSFTTSSSPAVPLIGGATRFWSRNMVDYVDVEARAGRVLVFQQANFLHSGEEVQQGLKLTLRTDLMYERLPDADSHSSLPKA